MKLFEYTATGRYYKTYIDSLYVSKHTTEREAVEKVNELKLSNPQSEVAYTHEYEVDVGLTDAGITIAQDYGTIADTPPVIASTPVPVFQEGTPLTYPMSQHVTDDGLSAVTYGLTNTLPNGLTFDAPTGVLTYDGVGAATVSAHQLTATDSVDTATSESFNISVEAQSGGGGDAWAYTGIPYPTDSTTQLVALGYSAWPYDPCTVTAPSRPATWTSNQTGFYYVEQGGSNSGNGYPNDPRGSIPSSVPAGSLIVIEGTLSLSNLSSTVAGSSSDPTFIVGNTGKDTDKITRTSGQIAFGGDYLVIDGIGFENASGSPASGVASFGGSFQTFRNCHIKDEAGFRSGFGAMSSPGDDHSMYYNVSFGPGGDYDGVSSGDHDYHGIKVFGDDHWFIECDFDEIQGDAIQISNEGGGASPTSAQRIFVGGCTGTNFHQTMLWTKDATDIIFSGNVATDGYDGNNGSTNGAFGGQGDYRNLWIIGNTSQLNGEGAKLAGTDSGASDAYVIGNLFYDQDPSNSADSGGYNNWAVSARNGGDTYVLLNTIHNVQAGIATLGSGNYVYGNFVDDPSSREHLLTNNSMSNDYNFLRGSSAQLSGVSPGSNNIVSNSPGFNDEAGDDFSLTASSALLDQVPDSGPLKDALDLFESRYGIDIRKDLLKNPRPANTSHDIGAYERQ